ncbi:ABC transporter permease [Clostridium tagluense]|uniref:FtsX-like permease family protein n=1 Tax=Clostridium tagluense TaxID=360422 RepID=UPI001C0D912B|nr:ABC transporter permease [Clostridium tagluense]MBU3129306.1 ABC transporter permease [Clostridium tagluense]MCB2312355.1 ABC transporter permease [Clostridium tagluense]MCB2317030.1 ABC transporter permease [Clostridium tagluense]MCB2321943.1 ABC transporter permease [Clostridium tagluense]MCB2326858.1 ABC transporter permease [Clostridium tagluense]
MNFREFSTKNVYRNIKGYFAYFLSSSISATLLFSFTMIIVHPDFVVLKLPNNIRNALYVTTVIAYLFLCFFVFYSVSVFLKSRYKEFGILYILGSSKKQIQRMITIENIIISSVSGVVGIIVGIVFSKILLAASGKLLGFKALGFYIPVKAMIITLIAFVLIGIVISIFCSFLIKEDMVLRLLKGTKKPKAEPKSLAILSIICIVLLTVGYYLSITSSEKTLPYRIIPVTIMVIVATYLLFSQLSVFILKLLKKNRNFYMKKTTVLWVSNLLYRIKDNTRMLFLITITSTVALSSIGSVYAYWRDKETEVNNNFPQAFFCVDTYNNKTKVDFKADFIENSLKNEGIAYTKVNGEMKFVIPNGYKDEVTIIKEEIYNKLALELSLKTIILKENETRIVEDLAKDERENVTLENKELKVVSRGDKGVIPAIYGKVYVVENEVYEKISGDKCCFGSFNVNNYKDTLNIGNNFNNKFGEDKGGKYYNDFLKAHRLEATKIVYGVILFSAIFIGLIFFVTTASFLYNKCYMDLIEDKKKYKQLNKIGLTYSEIKKVLNIEIGVLFLLPYIIAMVHFFFAISSLKYAFGIEVIVPALQIIGIMLIVQIIYFLVIRKNYLLEIKKSLV